MRRLCHLSGSHHEVVVPVKKNEQFIVWKFELEEHDIDFTVAFSVDPVWASTQLSDFNDTMLQRTVHARTRYLATTTGRPIEGTVQGVRCLPLWSSWPASLLTHWDALL